MSRLTKIEPATAHRLLPGDECYFFGEYKSHGGFQSGEFNQLISNLKIPVPVPAHRLKWKVQAIARCAQMLCEGTNAEVVTTAVTFVPVPGSKPKGHVEYDDRLNKVLHQYSNLIGGVDVRELVTTTSVRASQHASDVRATIATLQASMQVEQSALLAPLRGTIIVVDDVFTLGTSFRAMKNLIAPLPGVQQVLGVFFARTVWPPQDFAALLAAQA